MFLAFICLCLLPSSLFMQSHARFRVILCAFKMIVQQSYNLIACLSFYSCSRERGVWLGLSDVNSAGKLHWVNGSEAQEGEEGLPPRSPVARGNLCVSLDQRSQTSSHSCNARRAYVCQYNPQGRHQTLAQMHPHRNEAENKHLQTRHRKIRKKHVKTQQAWPVERPVQSHARWRLFGACAPESKLNSCSLFFLCNPQRG